MVGPGRHTNERRQSTSERAPEGRRPSVASVLSSFVPTSLARRAIAVSVGTDRAVYDRGEPVEITVEFRNRLPVAVDVPTPRQRRWGWSVDGELEATDERRYVRSRPSTFSFRGGERKRVSVTWSGRFERTDGRHEFVLPEPGPHEIRAFVATGENGRQPHDVTSIRIE